MSSQNQKLDSEILENQGPQEPEIEISGKGCDLRFEEVNEVTWKLTDGRGSNAGEVTVVAATGQPEQSEMAHGCRQWAVDFPLSEQSLAAHEA